MSLNYNTCLTCINYAADRFDVLVASFAEHCAETNETSQQALDRYMTGVHERHLSGLSLSVATTASDGK